MSDSTDGNLASNQQTKLSKDLKQGLRLFGGFAELISSNQTTINKFLVGIHEASLELNKTLTAIVQSIPEEKIQSFVKTLTVLNEYDQIGIEIALEITLLKFFYLHGDRDPIFAWEALSLAQQHQTPLPKWAAWEIASVAEAFTNVDTSKGKFEGSLKKALKIDGHSLRRIKEFDKIYSAYNDYTKAIELGAKTETHILEDIEKEYGLSPNKAKKEFKKFQEILELRIALPNPFSKE